MPVNLVTGSKLGGKYVVRRKVEVSRERRTKFIVTGVRKCDGLKKQVLSERRIMCPCAEKWQVCGVAMGLVCSRRLEGNAHWV